MKYSGAIVANNNLTTAFGSYKNLRQFNLAGARVGFNSKENDNEVKGTGNQQDYGLRIYDPRLGRFLSIDPIGYDYPWNSCYAFSENEPISNIDLDGLEKKKGTIFNVDACMDWRHPHRPRTGHVGSNSLKIAIRDINRKIHKITRKEDLAKKQNSNLPNSGSVKAGSEPKEKESTEPKGEKQTETQPKLREGEAYVPNFFTGYADGDVFKDKNSADFHDDVTAGKNLMKKVDDALKTFENKDEAELNITIGGGKDVSDEVKQKRGESLKKALEEKGFKGKISISTTNDNVPAIQIMGIDGDKKSDTKKEK